VNGCQALRDRRETVGAAQASVVVVSDTASVQREAGPPAIHPVGEFRFAPPEGPDAWSGPYL